MQAPITEEIVFRACVLTVYHLTQASRTRMIFLSPLLFGAGEGLRPHVKTSIHPHDLTLPNAAHIHHAWDTYNRYGRSPAALKRAVIGTGKLVCCMVALDQFADRSSDIAFQFTYTSVFGFYCSYLFLRTGSVFAPITAHVFCNIMGVPQLGYDISQRPDRKLGSSGTIFSLTTPIITLRAIISHYHCILPRHLWFHVCTYKVDPHGG